MRRTWWTLSGIILLIVFAAWVSLPDNPGIHFQIGGLTVDKEISAHRGLDLVGGMQVTLQADVPPGTAVEAEAMEAVKTIIENRINGLGVSEPQIQLQPETNRILVELPGVADPEEAIRSFRDTGLLEFVDTGEISMPEGTILVTSFGGTAEEQAGAEQTPVAGTTPTAEPTQAATPTAAGTPAANATTEAEGTAAAGTTPSTPTADATPAAGETQPQPQQPTVYQTILTGKDLKSASVGFDEFGRPMINFELHPEGGQKFAEHTRDNVNRFLTITMDKRVISSPRINSAIPDSRGVIEGSFALEEANRIVLQLKYGALPVPLKIVENRTIGPTLGADSVNKSLIAGGLGLALVMLFMVAYYRFPGVIAVVALTSYAVLAFATFKLVPVVLTLAGIAGFILSIGMAVDANILIFERTKEEMRSGKTIGAAIEAGFRRAWSSIWDSNVSTLITCAILFWFGTQFGASVIRGFALTLAIGVAISMFTAVTLTRTILRVMQHSVAGRPARAERWRALWVF